MDPLRCLGLFMILVSSLKSCISVAEYEIFPGFNGNFNKTSTTVTTSKPLTTSKVVPKILGSEMPSTTKTTVKVPLKKKQSKTTEDPLFTNSPYKPFVCPEEEEPMNIGPYEVPTQKDLAVHMKKTLLKMFKRYHKKALFFLNDISKATLATSVVEKKCPSQSRITYKRCVRHVSNQCQLITKSLVTSLERQRHDVSAFTEASICNVSSMKADPVQLIKTIAMEDASLEFALPGFLRLLGACSVYCQRTQKLTHWKEKPMRHMTDQDLVIRHFLTRKNYSQLITG